MTPFVLSGAPGLTASRHGRDKRGRRRGARCKTMSHITAGAGCSYTSRAKIAWCNTMSHLTVAGSSIRRRRAERRPPSNRQAVDFPDFCKAADRLYYSGAGRDPVRARVCPHASTSAVHLCGSPMVFKGRYLMRTCGITAS